MNDLFEFDVGDSNEAHDITQFMSTNEESSPIQSTSSGPSQSTIQSPIAAPAPFKKSKWTPDEDKLLIDSVKAHGMGNWSLVSQAVPGRTGKQCRERWINQLCPALNKDNWTPQEDAILIQQQRIHGNFWSKIAQFLPGRSSNNVKNRWSWLSRHRVPPSLAAQVMPYLVQQQQMAQMQQAHFQQQQFQQQQQVFNQQMQQRQHFNQFNTQQQHMRQIGNTISSQNSFHGHQNPLAQHAQRAQASSSHPRKSHSSINPNFMQGMPNFQNQQTPPPANIQTPTNNITMTPPSNPIPSVNLNPPMNSSLQTAPAELQWGTLLPSAQPKNRIAFSDPYDNISAPTSFGSHLSPEPEPVYSFGDENMFNLDDGFIFSASSTNDPPLQPPDDLFKPFDDWGTY